LYIQAFQDYRSKKKMSTNLVQCSHEVTNDTVIAIDGNRDNDHHCAGSHLDPVVDFLCSSCTFLCGTNDEERQTRALPHGRKPRDTRQCCSCKTSMGPRFFCFWCRCWCMTDDHLSAQLRIGTIVSHVRTGAIRVARHDTILYIRTRT
jgi:hypothetical protein